MWGGGEEGSQWWGKGQPGWAGLERNWEGKNGESEYGQIRHIFHSPLLEKGTEKWARSPRAIWGQGRTFF